WARQPPIGSPASLPPIDVRVHRVDERPVEIEDQRPHPRSLRSRTSGLTPSACSVTIVTIISMGRTVRHARTLAVLAAVTVAAGGAGASRNKQLRVGLVLESTRVSDLYEHGAYAGLQKAVRALSVQGKVAVPAPGQNFERAFTYLARQRYDLIIGLGFFETDALDTVARRFPHQKFAIVD